MKSSQDIDSVTAGGTGITDNEFICTNFNEFLSLLLLGCYLSESGFPTSPPATRAIATTVNLSLAPCLLGGDLDNCIFKQHSERLGSG